MPAPTRMEEGSLHAPPNTVRVDSLDLSTSPHYLSPTKLAALVDTIARIQANSVEGQFLEAGVALGGSAILIAK